ncbi:MAG: 16S rRNA (cytosine(967)-C(5))-methyltransferase, partial [Lachnospiraceae bacterium]|nr:16S rRNA (cytosine(967)-C(5))-methyltransferase [Lachnospiraceae bacterium]
MKLAVNEREIVLDMLLEVEKGTYSHIVSNNALTKYGYLDGQIRRFFKRTFEGTLEYRDLIDWVINYYSKTPVRKMKPVVRNILRLSVYQIMFMEVPAHAICNEAVKLTAKRGFSGLKGFVNGVLRSVLRSKDNLPMPDRNAGEKEYLSVKYSMPMWIVERWLGAYGAETCEHMLIESLK